MKKADCFFLGKIVSKHSFKGEVLIKLDTDEPELYENMESVFVSLEPSLIPFFIEKSRLHKTELLRVKFEGVSNEAEAASLIGKEIYLPLKMLPELTGTKFYFHEVIGFTVTDRSFGPVGTVTKVIETAAQPLLSIDHKGKQVLIPITDDIISELDRHQRVMHIDAPEGLIDLYLD